MSARTPKAVVYRGADGRWYWRLVAGNGEIQCPSEGYATRPGAHRGLQATRRNMLRAVVVEQRP